MDVEVEAAVVSIPFSKWSRHYDVWVLYHFLEDKSNATDTGYSDGDREKAKANFVDRFLVDMLSPQLVVPILPTSVTLVQGSFWKRNSVSTRAHNLC